MRLTIKNMVCPRCITSVEQILKSNKLEARYVRLGEVELIGELSPAQKQQLADDLKGTGFELLDDQKVDGSAEKLGTAAAAASGPPSSTDRPALQPPAPGTTPAALAAGSSSPIAPTTGGVGR